jgi:hypothetical protein
MARRKTSSEWEQIEAEYCQSNDSIREIGDRHSIDEGAIRKRAKAAGWQRPSRKGRSAAKCGLSPEAAPPPSPSDPDKPADAATIAEGGRSLVNRARQEEIWALEAQLAATEAQRVATEAATAAAKEAAEAERQRIAATSYNSDTGALTVDVRYTGGSGTFASWAVAISPPIIFRSATAAQIWAGAVDTVAVTPAGLLAAAAFVALADAATITPNLGAGVNFTVTLAGNRTLANPTNALPGMSGVIEIVQDGTGNRALAFGSAWKPRDRIAPSLSTSAGAINLLSYVVRSSGVIYFSVDGPF